jgi:hypothetical protein
MKIVWVTEPLGHVRFHYAEVNGVRCGLVCEGDNNGWQLWLPTHPYSLAGNELTLRRAKAALADEIDEWFERIMQ